MADTKIAQTRENNPNWKGGKSVTSHGYIVIRVGSQYIYEHRIIAEKKLGRLLKPNEKVHHIDKDRTNNHPNNLLVVDGNARHYLHHRKSVHLKKPDEPNLMIKCKCGCDGGFQKYDEAGRPRKYISGHNPQQKITQDKILRILSRGVLTTKTIRELLGISKSAANAALQRLHRKRRIYKVRRGIWRLLNV